MPTFHKFKVRNSGDDYDLYVLHDCNKGSKCMSSDLLFYSSKSYPRDFRNQDLLDTSPLPYHSSMYMSCQCMAPCAATLGFEVRAKLLSCNCLSLSMNCISRYLLLVSFFIPINGFRWWGIFKKIELNQAPRKSLPREEVMYKEMQHYTYIIILLLVSKRK